MCIYRYCVWNKWACTCLPCSLFTYKAVVNPEKGHLTGLVEQVGKSYEGIGCVQVQDEHSSDEGHSLHLKKHTNTESVQANTYSNPKTGDGASLYVSNVVIFRQKHWQEVING